MLGNIFGKICLSVLVAFAFFVSEANAMDIEVGKGRIIKLPRAAAHVFIADPEIADVDLRSQSHIYVYGLSVGQTSLHAVDSNHNEILVDTVNITPNLSHFSNAMKKILPNSDIYFESIGRGIVLKGAVDNPSEAETAVQLANAVLADGQSLINMLDVKGSDQVMLRVKVAEVSRSEVKNFGINMANVITSEVFSFGLFTGRDFIDAEGAFLRSGNSGRIQGSIGAMTVDTVIDALESEGLVKTLAEPNLTAKSGSAASFLAGGEFPIPVPQEDGVITIEYREFGVGLDFLPTVLSNNKISLEVAPEVTTFASSAVTFSDGSNIPTLATRRASTTVELGSGQSFAIAGLIQNNVSNDISKVPWLGDIPILGLLFRSNSFQNDETELVIIVTPYIVDAVNDPTELVTPDQGYVIPNDFERLWFGKLYDSPSEPGRAEDEFYSGALARLRLNGEPGFILE